MSSCKLIPGPTQALNRIEVGFKQLAEISSKMGEGEALVIDYRKMTGPFKTGKLDIEYWTIGEGKEARPTMLVKSINSEIEGREAEAIKAVAGAIGSVAKLALTASGVPLAAGGIIGNSKPPVVCNEDVLTAIQQINDNDKTLKSIAKMIEKLTLQVTLISGRVVGGKLTTEDDRKLGEAQIAMDQLTEQMDNLVKSTKKLKTFLTYKQSYPLAEFDWPQGAVSPMAKLTKKLLPDAGKLAELALKAVDFHDSLCKLTADNTKTCEAIKASLVSKANSSEDGETISELATTAPQYGRVRVLPLRSRFAEKNGLSAQFAQNGMPTKVTYNAYQAGGAAAFDSTKALFDQANIVADRVAANKKAKDEQAKGIELQAIKDEITLLTETQKLAALEKAPDAEIAARDAELAKLRFEVARMELLAQLGRNED